ncbi:MAG: SoxR reducing system RseC family protein [Prevotella sp.]|jgi:sigma-E factor negative regulatory protein RseC|nr:SoxR reducing system RseC family protein [Prevotella sp.]
MSNKISHSGVIEQILDGCVKVRIVQTSACAACKVAAHCNAAESKIKIVDVFCSDNSTYQVGQDVVVWASKDVANKALLLGFGIPFLLLICVLLIALRFTSEEGIAALTALGSLVPYYFMLWLLRKKIQRQIAFHIDN